MPYVRQISFVYVPICKLTEMFLLSHRKTLGTVSFAHSPVV